MVFALLLNISLLGPLSLAADPTIEELKALGDQERTVDGVLSRLSPEYRSEFTLIKESKAPGSDEVSPTQPRVIWYGKSGRLIVAVHGDPKGDRYHRIEAMSFGDDKFSLFTQDFDPAGIEKPTFRDRTADGTCTKCHFSDPRPNWSHYATWPGAFAGNDDSLWSEMGEFEEFEKFQASIDSTSRYRHLESLEFGYRSNIDSPARTLTLHNRDMTDRLSALNARRVARLIRETPDFAIHRETVESLLERSRAKYRNSYPDEGTLSDLLESLGFSMPFKLRNIENLEMEPLERWLESRGVSTVGWSMSFDHDGVFESGGGNHSFRDSGEIGLEILQALREPGPTYSQAPPSLR